MPPNREFREPSSLRAFEPSNLRTGFTLIEVLVATAVMAIMVVMIGGLFQQASSSWDAGYVRAEGGMAVRAVVGALTRDAATAVDGRRFGLSAPVEVTGSQITMYRLAPGAVGGNRDIVKVVYKGRSTVTRTVGSSSSTIYSGGTGSSGANFTFSAGPEADGTQNAAATRPYERRYYDSTGAQKTSDFPAEVLWNVPYVKVRCQLTRKGTFSGLTVRSLGRDGIGVEEKSQDDIIVR